MSNGQKGKAVKEGCVLAFSLISVVKSDGI